MKATLERKWVSGLPSGWMWCLSAPGAGLPIDGLPMDRQYAQAVREVAALNERRATLGLEAVTLSAERRPPVVAFREADCGGAFDGFAVTSDADCGL